MHFAIIGPGAIGSLFALCLKHHHHDVALFGREQKPIIRDYQGPLFTASNQYLHAPITDINRSHVVLCCVKAWQQPTALNQFAPHFHHQQPIVVSHNGMGAIDHQHPLWQLHPLFALTTTNGAMRFENTLHHTGLGQSVLGPLNPLAQASQDGHRLCTALTQAQLQCSYDPHIETRLWQKLVINSVINPLTARDQCPNGALAHPAYQAEINRLVEELWQITTLVGFDWTPAAMKHSIHTVIQATHANLSSMNRDIAAHRRTEIDYITGYLLQRATRYGVSLPHHQSLYEQIKTKEGA